MPRKEKNQAIVKRLIEDAFNNRNLSILPELLHEEFVNHHDLLPVENKKGPAVFEELYTKLFESFPDIKIYNNKILSDGDMVIIYDILKGTNTGPMPDGQPSSGKTVEFETINLLRIKDGKIIDRWGLTDQLTMMKQLGLIE